MKKIFIDLLRIVLVMFILSFSIIVPTMIIPVSQGIASRMTEEIQNNMMGLMLLVSLLGAISLFVTIRLSNWKGIKLAFALSFSFFGIEYFMAQIETFFFREAFTFMTNLEILNILLRGLITTLMVVPLAVVIIGNKHKHDWVSIKNATEKIDLKTWIKKAALFAIFYILIYQFFGHFVAWQFEAVRVFYSGTTEKLSFINQFINTIKQMPLFLPYHFIRGLLWVVFSIPIVLMMAGSRKKTMISLALLFSYHGFQIIMAQGIFPTQVLIGHSIETTVSASIYGALIGYMFYIPNKTLIK